ncbi:DUF4198 domain-containing protein [Brevundimonas variabilis]|uniref:ABC transporter permease n=1 Tax=Brevundimonas variabilis TaxID=74312 RepID=A0A7W9CIQ6_9CAUL|nr:DUF4198 domain-containing protein [Brevundimonas variabilis]MBB5746377.1 hypothetical protein [Brevundimonas variabilis]
MKRSLALLALTAALATPFGAQAHRAWMLPSATTLSGTEAWISIDAGASNQVFVADHAALGTDNLVILAPDGSTVTPANMMRGQYRSTFDVHLTQPGTYKIASVSAGMSANYTLDGEARRWRGPVADFPSAIPTGATDVRATRNVNRMETFATLGEPTDSVFAPTGQGLELVPVTHPTDLVVGEAATFTLLKNGQPAAAMDVTVARSGARYRDNPGDTTVRTDAAGRFSITWPEAGMYWLNASQRDEPEGTAPASQVQYTAIVEVLP